MKKKVVKIIHSLFRLGFFEKLLLPVVKDKYVDHFLVKFIPPNKTYKKHTYRTARSGSLTLYGDLHDYNDWKAYWRLKEIERETLYKLAKNAKLVVDVGTNNGWLLMNISRIIKSNNGFVYGFEPHPDTFARCMNNIGKSNISNCKVFNMGCGESESEMVMTVENESNSGRNRIDINANRSLSNKAVNIKITTLDKLLSSIGKIDLIKIDVEGFELQVLKGSDIILKQHKPVIFMEVDDILLRANNTTPAELFSFLADQYGYSFTYARTGNEVKKSDVFTGCHMDIICNPGEKSETFL